MTFKLDRISWRWMGAYNELQQLLPGANVFHKSLGRQYTGTSSFVVVATFPAIRRWQRLIHGGAYLDRK